MTIWLVIEGEPLPIDGKETRIMRMGILAEMLSKKGHNVVWWESTYNHFKKTYREKKDMEIRINDLCVLKLIHALPYRKNISLARIIHMRQTAKKFYIQAETMQQPDIIFAAMPTIDLAQSAVMYGCKHGVPVLVDLRDAWPDILQYYFPKSLSFLLRIMSYGMQIRLKNLLSAATGIIGLSEPFLEWGLKKIQRKKNSMDGVFPIGYIANNKSNTKPISSWLELGVDCENLIIVFFGSISYSSNLEHVIIAAKQISPNEGIQFIICGDGAKLKDLRAQANSLSHVFFTGNVGITEIASLASIAKLGIIPYKKASSFSMHFVNKFSEYLSYDLPILIYTDGIMQKTAKENGCGLCYDSPDEMVQQIRFFKDNINMQNEMKKAAKRLYEEQFEANNVYGNMINHFENIVKADIRNEENLSHDKRTHV